MGTLKVASECTYKLHDYWKSYEQYFLGTESSHRFSEAMSAQLSLSRIVGVAIGKVWKVHPATTLKDVILDDWLHNSSIELGTEYDPQPGYLDYITVLEVSRCSGNARRISLRDVLTIPEVVRWLHTIYDRDTLVDMNAFLTNPKSYSNSIEAWSYCPRKASVRRIIRTILRALKKTGVNSKASLQVWDITYADKKGGLMGRKLNQSWIPMVKDSESIASFAVMTNRCIEVRSAEKRVLRTDITLLFTEVSINLHAYNVTDEERSWGLEEADTSSTGVSTSFEDSLDQFENDFQDPQLFDRDQNLVNVEEHDDLHDHTVPYQAVPRMITQFWQADCGMFWIILITSFHEKDFDMKLLRILERKDRELPKSLIWGLDMAPTKATRNIPKHDTINRLPYIMQDKVQDFSLGTSLRLVYMDNIFLSGVEMVETSVT